MRGNPVAAIMGTRLRESARGYFSFSILLAFGLLAVLTIPPARAASCHSHDDVLQTFSARLGDHRLTPRQRSRVLVERGQRHLEQGFSARAIGDYTAAFALDPADYSVLELRGLAYAAQHRYVAASRDFDRAVAMRGATARTLARRADSRFNLGQLAAAIEDYTAAIALDTDPAWYLGRANAYRDSGRYREAFADYEVAVRSSASNAMALFHRALAHHRRDEFLDEQRDWRRAIARQPNIYWRYGIVYRHRHLYNELWSDHDSAIRRAPDSAKAYFNRGRAHYHWGRRCEAVRDFTIAIEKRAGFAKAYLARGVTWYESGDYVRAIDDLSLALARLPKTKAYYYRSLSYASIGDISLAKVDAHRAQQRSPLNPVVRALVAAIDAR